jgi:serine/threonine protein kinase
MEPLEQTERTSYLIDYRTDLYSLGIIMWEYLTGEHPYKNIDQTVRFNILINRKWCMLIWQWKSQIQEQLIPKYRRNLQKL